MKKETKLWIILDSKGNPGDIDVIDCLFSVKKVAADFVRIWNQNRNDPQSPYSVRRVTLALEDEE